MLDNSQLEAVNFYKGPCLTLAGPGSGKTTVLVNRIKNLIDNYNVKPESVLVITFTKDAALEMKSRFLSLSDNPKAGLVNFGTFHSVFYQILRRDLSLDSDSVLQGKSLIAFLKEAAKVNNIKIDDELLESLYKEFSFLSNTSTDIDSYESESFDTLEFRRLYKAYQSMKEEHSKIDFDDMLKKTYMLFKNNPKILSKWQKRFSFFLIDEMQDMNDIQFAIVRMLAKSENIFAVGDDDQSIYGFRGANPEIMLKFPEVYKDCKIIRLVKNYRSCQDIVNASYNLITNNEHRFNKTLSAYNKAKGTIDIVEMSSNEAEAVFMSKEA